MITPLSRMLLIFVLIYGFATSVIAQTSSDDVQKIEFDFTKAKTLGLSEIVTDIKYIPLETTPDCLIGNMMVFRFDNDIYVQAHDGNESIYRFNKDGSYLNKIGTCGRGPNEYSWVSELFTNDDGVFLVSSMSNTLLGYGLDGTFKSRMKFGVTDEVRIKNLFQNADNSFLLSTSDGKLLHTDSRYNIKEEYFNNEHFLMAGMSAPFQKSGDKVFCYRPSHEIIYNVANGKPEQAIRLEFENYKKSKERFARDEKSNKIRQRPHLSRFRADDKYMKFDITYPFEHSNSYGLLYCLSDGKQYTWSGMKNDLDGGILDRWQGCFYSGKLIFTLMPLTILKHYSEMNDAEKRNPKNAGFVKMASELKADDNPVLMVCKLK